MITKAFSLCIYNIYYKHLRSTMSNTFFAVFFGSALGLFTVNLATSIVDEYRAKKRRKDLNDLLDHLEDIDLEEYE